MTSKILALNIVYAIVDTVIAALAICVFGGGAYYFGKWWLLLFNIVPLALYSTHSLIVETDMEAAQKGGENDSGEIH